jgi:hypothetical protein
MRTAVSLEPPVAMITDFWKRFGTVTFKVTSVTTVRRTRDTLVNGSGIILGWIEGRRSMRSCSYRHGCADKRAGRNGFRLRQLSSGLGKRILPTRKRRSLLRYGDIRKAVRPLKAATRGLSFDVASTIWRSRLENFGRYAEVQLRAPQPLEFSS